MREGTGYVADLDAHVGAVVSGGVGRVKDPTTVEKADVNGWSAGLGIRAAIAERVDAEMEFARTDTNVFSEHDTHLSVRLRVRF